MNQEKTVFSKLREMILNGDLAAGERLTERGVCELLGVSRTPVRAAMLRLAEQSLVTGQVNRGYTVRGISVRDVWDANVVRAVLEGSAAGLLARDGMDAETRAALRDSIDQYEALARHVELSDDFLARHAHANRQFHKALVQGTGNDSLARSISRLAYMPVQINRTVFASDRRAAVQTVESGLAEHHAVFNAIQSRDAAAAEILMRTHSQKALRGIEMIRDHLGLGPDDLDMPFHQFITSVSRADAA